MEQKYRMLEVGEPLIAGDEFRIGGVWVSIQEAETGVARIFRYRHPVAAEETITEVREAWQKDHMEMKRKLDAAVEERMGIERMWFDQRAELADARNQITDLTRRLEDALSDNVIAEAEVERLRKVAIAANQYSQKLSEQQSDADALVAALRKILA